MLLSVDVFDGVVGAMDPAAAGVPVVAQAAGPGSGQRRGPRISLRSRLTIVPCPEGLEGAHGPPLSVPVRDLSRGGIRFLLPRRLPLDTQFMLLLPRTANALSLSAEPSAAADVRPAGADVIAVECSVIYWQPLARDLFAIGGQFTRLLEGVAVPGAAPRVVLPDYEGETPADARRAAS